MKKFLKYLIILIIVPAAIMFNSSCTKPERINKVYTDSVSVRGTSAVAYGCLLDISKQGIQNYGFCWDTLPEPSLNSASYMMPQTAQKGAFHAGIDNLEPYETYYIRAFINEADNIIYGNVITITLTALNGISVATSLPVVLNISSANVSGIISGIGSLSIADYGHCWAETTNPTVNNYKTSLGPLNNDTTFSSTLTGLDLSTNYYVRAYVKINDNTVIYGNETMVVLPELTVATDTFQFLNTTDVKLSGNIILLGINPVTNHGFCWSYTMAAPNINDEVLSLGAAQNTGTFSDTLPVQSGITYYFRAFATDGNYVKYGAVKQFIKN